MMSFHPHGPMLSMEPWRITGEVSRVTGHGENETMLKIEKAGVPCPIYVGDGYVPSHIQRRVAGYVCDALNLVNGKGIG